MSGVSLNSLQSKAELESKPPFTEWQKVNMVSTFINGVILKKAAKLLEVISILKEKLMVDQIKKKDIMVIWEISCLTEKLLTWTMLTKFYNCLVQTPSSVELLSFILVLTISEKVDLMTVRLLVMLVED